MDTMQLNVIGGGTMAKAIVYGSIDAGATRRDQWGVAEPDDSRREQWAAQGFRVADKASALGGETNHNTCTILAVKPQMLDAVATDLQAGPPQGLVISILAGKRSETVHQAVGGAARVVRVMPNTPASIGLGMSAMCPGPGASAEDLAFSRALFSSIGRCIEIDEGLMDAFTAVGGSGPAYLFALAEAMESGAKGVGFSGDDAREITRQTLLGAASLLAGDARGPGELREAVTSRKGTTHAALEVLRESGFGPAVERAVVAARDRGRTLAAPETQ